MGISELRDKIIELKTQLKKNQKTRVSTYGHKIKHHRKKLGYTQEQLSMLIGLSRSQIANIELGNASTRIETLLNFCEILDVTPNDLLGY